MKLIHNDKNRTRTVVIIISFFQLINHRLIKVWQIITSQKYKYFLYFTILRKIKSTKKIILLASAIKLYKHKSFSTRAYTWMRGRYAFCILIFLTLLLSNKNLMIAFDVSLQRELSFHLTAHVIKIHGYYAKKESAHTSWLLFINSQKLIKSLISIWRFPPFLAS